ncbi:hypothetical protein HMPREF9554_00170 [Treponema phagedenis F0421]|nr:hypothetical protein HMPREF9554_00170 [Treponema phagedenis F0421]
MSKTHLVLRRFFTKFFPEYLPNILNYLPNILKYLPRNFKNLPSFRTLTLF